MFELKTSRDECHWWNGNETLCQTINCQRNVRSASEFWIKSKTYLYQNMADATRPATPMILHMEIITEWKKNIPKFFKKILKDFLFDIPKNNVSFPLCWGSFVFCSELLCNRAARSTSSSSTVVNILVVVGSSFCSDSRSIASSISSCTLGLNLFDLWIG